MDGVLGATDGVCRIVMHPDQSQAQRRCTLAHELAHVELGHTGPVDAHDERATSQLAARWLITLEQLLDALRWADDLPTVADELWVDEPTLLARLDGLTDAERAALMVLWQEVERGC